MEVEHDDEALFNESGSEEEVVSNEEEKVEDEEPEDEQMEEEEKEAAPDTPIDDRDNVHVFLAHRQPSVCVGRGGEEGRRGYASPPHSHL